MKRLVRFLVLLALIFAVLGSHAARAQTAADAIARGVKLVRDGQLADGAFRLHAEGDPVLIIPYFSNYAALALLANGTEADLNRVAAWLEWYARHQRPDGSIYNFDGALANNPGCTWKDGEAKPANSNCNWRDTNNRDSVDAPAASFLMVVERYSRRRSALPPGVAAAAAKALNAIQSVTDSDGLTWAKTTPEIPATDRFKYLQDNVIVYSGLVKGAEFFASYKQSELATTAREMAQKLGTQLPRYLRTAPADLSRNPGDKAFAYVLDAYGNFQFKGDNYLESGGMANLFGLAWISDTDKTPWHQLDGKSPDRGIYYQDPPRRPDPPRPQAPVERWYIGALHGASPTKVAELRQETIVQASAFAYDQFQPDNDVYIYRPAIAVLALLEGSSWLPSINTPPTTATRPALRGQLAYHVANGTAFDEKIWYINLSNGTAPVDLDARYGWNLSHMLNPHFSPDGSKMVFAAVPAGNRVRAAQDIYLWRVGSSAPPLNLTSQSGAGIPDEDARFTPDGNIVYKRNGQLARMTATDSSPYNYVIGNSSQQTIERSGPSVSADGNSLLFFEQSGANAGIYRASASNGSGRTLVADQPNVQEYYPVAWKENLFLYAQWIDAAHGEDQIYSVDIETKAQNRFLFNDLSANNSDPYPMDDRYIFFCSNRSCSNARGAYDLYLGDSQTGQSWSLSDLGVNSNNNELGIAYSAVTFTNRAPALDNATFNATRNVAFSKQLVGTDVDGDTLSYKVTAGTLPDGLTLSTNGLLAGTPTVAGSSVVTVEVADDKGGTGTAQITVNVTPPPPAPTIRDVSGNAITGRNLVMNLSGTDPVGGGLTYRLASWPRGSGSTGGAAVNQSNGQWTLTYRSSASFSGTDTVKFVATDSIGRQSNVAMATITVSSAVPTAANVSGNAKPAQTISLVLSGSDPAGGALSYRLAGWPRGSGTTGGASVRQSNGQWRLFYRSSATFTGTDTVKFVAVASNGAESAPATATITVTLPPPSANDVSGNALSAQTISMVLSGSDPAGGGLTYRLAGWPSGSGTTGGASVSQSNGQWRLYYRSSASFSGTDTVKFVAVDSQGRQSAPATASIVVRHSGAAMSSADSSSKSQSDASDGSSGGRS